MKIKKKEPNKDKVVVSSEQYEGKDNMVYICSWCSCTLSKLIDSSGQNPSLYCSRCQMSFDPEYDNLRHESKITIPNEDIEPAAVSLQYTADLTDEVSIRHTPEMRGGFAQLAKKGTIKFTSYNTTEKQ
jgi:hypothetical protein